MRIQEERLHSNKKVHRRIFVRDITFVTEHLLSYVIFCGFFRLLLPFRLIQFYKERKFCSRKWWGGRGVGGSWGVFVGVGATPLPPVPTTLKEGIKIAEGNQQIIHLSYLPEPKDSLKINAFGYFLSVLDTFLMSVIVANSASSFFVLFIRE